MKINVTHIPNEQLVNVTVNGLCNHADYVYNEGIESYYDWQRETMVEYPITILTCKCGAVRREDEISWRE